MERIGFVGEKDKKIKVNLQKIRERVKKLRGPRQRRTREDSKKLGLREKRRRGMACIVHTLDNDDRYFCWVCQKIKVN